MYALSAKKSGRCGEVAFTTALTSGGSRGGAWGPASPLFSDQTEAQRRADKKYFGDRPPPFSYLKALLTVFSSFPTRQDILLFSNEAIKITIMKLLKIIAGLVKVIFHPCLLYNM